MRITASLKLKWTESTNAQFAVCFRRCLSSGLVLLPIMFATFQTARAQSYLTQIGVPPFTTALPVENGFLNLANGNLHLSIPLGSFPERGSDPFVAGLVYDSRIWQVVSGTSNSWQPNSQGGWRFVTSGDTGNASFTTYGDRYGAGITSATWTDPLGTAHWFPVNLALSSNGSCVDSSSSAFANDATGYYTSWTHSCSNNSVFHTFYSPDGTVVNSAGPGNYAPGDTNGNYFSKDANGNVIDTLGRTPITYVASGTGCSTNYCYNILNSQGSTSQIKITTTTVNVNTAFGQSGVTEYSGSFTAIQSMTLPDGNSYTFAYDSGTTAGHYGGLTSITLPTGGQITYGYTKFQDSFGNRNMWASSRTSGGGTWSYTPAVITTCAPGTVGCKQQVTVAKPSGDNQLYIFTLNNGAWRSTVYSYTGAALAANLASTVSSSWDFSQSCSPQPCTGASNVRVLTTTTTLPSPGVNNITSQIKLTYSDVNTQNVASVKDWKFYVGTSPTFPTTPDRETDFTYHANFGNNIINRISQTTVKDSGGNVVAQTNYSYDDLSSLFDTSPATGIANHDDTNYSLSNTVRGNLTKIQRCTVFAACSSNYVQTKMTYDTTGQVLSVQDPNTNTISFSYTDNFFKDVGDGPANPPQPYPVTPVVTNAYLSTLTPPAIPASTFGHYYHTGQLASSKGPNGNTSYLHFFDPSFSRPTSTVLPDGGWSFSSYTSSETQTDVYTGITGAFSQSAGVGIRQDEAVLDNLARVSTQKLVSDPEGSATVTTNYDTTGRVLNVSHPARTTASTTDGTETPSFDSLGRIIKTTHQDATFSQLFYGAAVSGSGVNSTQLCLPTTTYGLGYPTLSIDEAGKKRETWTDGFGRTIEADEPDSSGNLASSTCYSYDSLGNLLQIVRPTQTRTYAYDTLSRVTSVTIPELANSTGTHCAVTYAYDSNSNIQTQTAPAPNQSTCTSQVTITYSHDVLNRLTGKTYSDSTPAVKYGYDGVALTGCSTTPPTLTDSNPKGRMTSMCDASGATSWAHDTTGKILTEKRTILGITQTISYSYNLDGSVATVTYPSSKVITYTVSNAQRLTAVKDVANSVQFATAASYAPPGGLSGVITGQISGGFGGITESHTYNGSLEYTSTRATSTAGTAMDLTLTYNPAASDNDSVTGVTNNVDSGRTQTLTYDPLNRISSATSQATSGVDCWGQNFVPDALANLNTISNAQCTNGTLSVTVDANNHINTDSTYAYDAPGNMTKDGSGAGWLYAFDAENRLTLATGPTGGPYCYVYDGNGLRVAKKSGTASDCTGGSVVKLYWRSLTGDSLAETDGSGSTTNSAYNEYVFFAGRRIASRNGAGGIFYYFADQLGSTRTITTGSGTGQTSGQLCYDADFTPYGQEISHTENLQTPGCPTNYKFTGYERDPETGLDYAFARYYSSHLGRFLSTDPHGGSVGNLQSNNAYAFVLNNPANLTDPFGLTPQKHPRRHPQYPPRHAIDCLWDSTIISHSGGGCNSTWDPFALLNILFMITSWRENPDCPNGDCTPGTPRWLPVFGNSGTLAFAFPGPGANSGGTSRPKACGPPQTGFGILLVGGGSAAVGVVKAGGEIQGTAGGGIFFNSQDIVSLGGELSGGAAGRWGDSIKSVPTQLDKPAILGAYAGYGPGIMLTNAGSADQLKGPFQTLTVDLGVGMGKGSIQLASSNGIWTATFTGGPAPYSDGVGLDVNYSTTTTIAKGTNKCP